MSAELLSLFVSFLRPDEGAAGAKDSEGRQMNYRYTLDTFFSFSIPSGVDAPTPHRPLSGLPHTPPGLLTLKNEGNA